MSVARLSVAELVDKAIEEAPEFLKTSEPSSDSSVKLEGNKQIMLADELDKLASNLEAGEKSSLKEFKQTQETKTAEIKTVVNTYLELSK
jgi:hypothetical protein